KVFSTAAALLLERLVMLIKYYQKSQAITSAGRRGYATLCSEQRGRTPPQNKQRRRASMSILTDISENLQKGKAKIVKELVQQAIDQGLPVQQILDEGLLAGMGVIGEKFKNNEVFVPEVLVAARAMNMGAALLKPLMAQAGVEAV